MEKNNKKDTIILNTDISEILQEILNEASEFQNELG